MIHIDEAYTSLEAIKRYGARLSPTDVQQLVGDALARLGLLTALIAESGVRGAIADHVAAARMAAEEAREATNVADMREEN